MQLINSLSLSEEGFRCVHDYMKDVCPDVNIEGNFRLTSKKNVMKKVRSAVNRRPDQTLIVKTFEVPAGIPWIEQQTIEFKVVCCVSFIISFDFH